MTDLGFHALSAPWWPYLFILLAGWLPTDIWRVLGVLSADRIDEASPAIALTRAIATGMVAAVIGRLVLYPTGSLEQIPDPARITALIAGFCAYFFGGRHVIVGVMVGEVILVASALAFK